MAELSVESPANVELRPGAWYRDMTRYCWFVLIVAAMGWMFDCLDQHLFNQARRPALEELLAGTDANPAAYGFYVTGIFLVGWGTGGLIFGALGDRLGRAKTMALCILAYSVCTGLVALSKNFWMFAGFQFMTGLGVGGEFAVGV